MKSKRLFPLSGVILGGIIGVTAYRMLVMEYIIDLPTTGKLLGTLVFGSLIGLAAGYGAKVKLERD